MAEHRVDWSKRGYTPDDLRKAVAEASSYAHTLRNLGLRPVADNYRSIRAAIKDVDADVSHFSRRPPVGGNKKHPLEDIFSGKVSYRNNQSLLRRLISEGYKEYRCEGKGCKVDGVWLEHKIKLELDHINGVPDDNRLENLRILCPNCHSQTDTFRRYGNILARKCPGCGDTIKQKVNACRDCYDKEKYKQDWPHPEELIDRLRFESYSSLSKELGVEPSSIRYYLRKAGFEPPKKRKTGSCEVCQEPIQPDSKRCKKCRERPTKIDWPPVETILDKLKDMPYTRLADELGVSDNAIRKHLENQGIEPPKRK